MSKFNILVLPGDGIGPEVTSAAKRVLNAVASRWGHQFIFTEGLVGGRSIDIHGSPLLQSTIAEAKRNDAILFGAVGGPRWDNAPVRPEAAILGLRKALGLYANLRPVKVDEATGDSSPLKYDRIRGTDFIIVRELTGGLYFAKPKRRWSTNSGRRGIDTLRYTEKEIERILRVGFQLARGRRKKLTSVDKANVLESSRLWREIANEIGQDYPDVELEHALVDSCAMNIIAHPSSYDVLVMDNMFGDILSDEVAVLVASLGMLPSASLAGLPDFGTNGNKPIMGLYEPIHGSAPDIAGQGKANPVGTILSSSLMLRYSFGLVDEADAIVQAVEKSLNLGLRTADIAGGSNSSSTEEFTQTIVDNVSA